MIDPDAALPIDAALPPGTAPKRSKAKQTRSIVFRAIFVVGALVASGFILLSTFDDLDYQAIVDSVAQLEDADIIALVAMWAIWIACQGLLTACLIKGLPVRRGVLAYLGPAGITSIIPGPSDLPFRHKMFTAWGYSATEATLAVAAGGVFSIGIKLILPVVAAIGLLVSDAPIDGTLRTVVVIAVIVGLSLLAIAYVVGAESRTERMGRVVAPIWAFALKLLRRPNPADLPQRMIAVRAEALARLRDRWLIGTWATMLTAATRFALLLMAVRFTGTPESAVSWPQVFIVYAVVQGLTVIPITAGDAGVSEVAYIGLLAAAAGEGYVNQITAGILIFRVLTWVVIIPIGLSTLAVWQRTRQRATNALEPATVGGEQP